MEKEHDTAPFSREEIGSTYDRMLKKVKKKN